MSFYDYGIENILLQSSPKPFKLHFFLKCVLDCLESCERREVRDSYIPILNEAERYLKDIIDVVFEGKQLEDYAELQNDYSYVISGLNIEDFPRAKYILLETIEEINRLRQNTSDCTSEREIFRDTTKMFLHKVLSSSNGRILV